MKKPLVLVIMDGVGKGDGGPGDAVALAKTPNLDRLFATCPYTWLKAHGDAVGLPSDDDMGNSEVGHNALGCGQVYSQGAKLVQESIENGSIYQSPIWKELIANCKENGKTLHFLGLLSDGNVHSNIGHLIALLRKARAEDLKSVCVHALLDGRDVPATSALEYIDQIEAVLAELSDADHNYRIASGGGRMKITMDRYQADWNMVRLGWEAHVHAQGRQFASAREAIETLRAENEGVIDQDLPPFVIAKDGAPLGKVNDGDSVVLYNFRGDRALEISMAFDYDEFPYFDRGVRPDVIYAGMLQYDGDLNIPRRFLVNPPEIKETLSELLVSKGMTQFAVSETQKYGHVTYFWNGNRSEKFSEELETFMEIPSDKVSFDERPWMKSAEITDAVIEAMIPTAIWSATPARLTPPLPRLKALTSASRECSRLPMNSVLQCSSLPITAMPTKCSRKTRRASFRCAPRTRSTPCRSSYTQRTIISSKKAISALPMLPPRFAQYSALSPMQAGKRA